MPVAAVARESRRLEAEDCADDALADLTDEATKTGAIDRAACGPTKILVDHNDLPEAVLLGQLCKLILSTLTLEVLLDLSGRLPYVDDGPTSNYAWW